eukprot:sb/3468687/
MYIPQKRDRDRVGNEVIPCQRVRRSPGDLSVRCLRYQEIERVCRLYSLSFFERQATQATKLLPLYLESRCVARCGGWLPWLHRMVTMVTPHPTPNPQKEHTHTHHDHIMQNGAVGQTILKYKTKILLNTNVTVHQKNLFLIQHPSLQEPTETSKQPIRTRYLGHVTSCQPIRDQYSSRFLPPSPFNSQKSVFQRSKQTQCISVGGRSFFVLDGVGDPLTELVVLFLAFQAETQRLRLEFRCAGSGVCGLVI